MPAQNARTQRRPGWAERGSAAVDHGDLEAARQCFAEAVRGERSDAGHRYHLALVEEALGNLDAAGAGLTQALRLDPTMADAARRLSLLAGRCGGLGEQPGAAPLDAAGLKAALAHATVDREPIAETALRHLAAAGVLGDTLATGRREGWDAAARALCRDRTAPLLKDELLLAVLRTGSFRNPDLERLLTALRRTLLLEVPPERLADRALFDFALALAAQCEINEHVWAVGDDEAAALDRLALSEPALLAGDVAAGRMLLLGMLYRPLSELLGTGTNSPPAAPTLDDETVRATTSPPPLWGTDRVGGIAEHRRSGVPPPLTPPHKGEGDPRRTCLQGHATSRGPQPGPCKFFTPQQAEGIRPRALRAVVVRRLAEAADERERALRLPRLGPKPGTSADATVQAVARQYEASPYPRWTSVGVVAPARMRRMLAHHFGAGDLTFLDRPFQVLIAGCGTGQQAVQAALAYGPNARVLAIDLSAASLAYAARKAERFGAGNIAFAQADLQSLADLGEEYIGRFDVIECTGVLHHLADPFAGWRRLIQCLARDGRMLLGLYSAVARCGLRALRDDPAYPGPGCPDSALRRFRQVLLDRPAGAPGGDLKASRDFYTTSNFRDLALHVSEHPLALPEIARFLDENALSFRGFQLERGVFARFQAQFPDATWPGTLEHWAAFEATNPGTFNGMYNFWVRNQKSE